MQNSIFPGAKIPRILLPKKGIDLTKWAVIACDQFTSQPDYWHWVRDFVDRDPSTYRMILPEVYLGTSEEKSHGEGIQPAMRQALVDDVLVSQDGLIYIERIIGAKIRKGLMIALDLEEYDFKPDSRSLIRASEGTILDRLPPRIRIREGAPLEIPHIIVLIDDPDRTVIDPFSTIKPELPQLYDFELMAGSGRIAGYGVSEPNLLATTANALKTLCDPQIFHKKYGENCGDQPLLYAVGDGNHSLATAKSIWEKIKEKVGPDHPARYALVELENIYDEGLEFRPIHRILFGMKKDLLHALTEFFKNEVTYTPCKNQDEMTSIVDNQSGENHWVGVVSLQSSGVIKIHNPSANLPVGTLQLFLDDFLRKGGADRIDYVHGEEVIFNLGKQPTNLGFYLPTMKKEELFRTILLNGVLPRKAFSMGEASEKRFYLECREIE
jgi:hypothetical protein